MNKTSHVIISYNRKTCDNRTVVLKKKKNILKLSTKDIECMKSLLLASGEIDESCIFTTKIKPLKIKCYEQVR
jgi:hypothetical protein